MDDKHQHILDQCGRIFWKFGIKSVTMDDVARHMGISKKTLYHFVTDKNDLVLQVSKCINEGIQNEIDQIRGQGLTAIDEMYEVTRFLAGRMASIHPSIHFDLEKYHPDAWREMIRYKREKISACITANMVRGIDEGCYRDDLNVPVLARIYIARFDMVFDGDLFPPNEYNLADVNWELFRYHIRGIASRKGLEYLEKKVKKERAVQ